MFTFNLGAKIYMAECSLDPVLEGRKNVLIITDKFIAESGMVNYVTRHLDKIGASYAIFSDVHPDPDTGTVTSALEAMEKQNADCIIAMGGGSPIDTAKAVRFFWETKLGQNPVHFIVIPTTSGTGSEVSAYAVITDKEKGAKYPLISDRLLPDAAVLDASLVLSVPPKVTADTGIDVLTHALEAFVSVKHSDFSDAMAEKAIQLICHNLPVIYKDGKNLEARQSVHDAACMAGIAFSNAGLGLNHAMAHALGARFHIPHGRANGILLPYVMKFNAGCDTKLTETAQRYATMAHVLRIEGSSIRQSALALIRSVKNLVDKLGIPTTIQLAGVSKENFEAELDTLATLAMADRTLATNPVTPTKEQVIELFRFAYHGKL